MGALDEIWNTLLFRYTYKEPGYCFSTVRLAKTVHSIPMAHFKAVDFYTTTMR